MGFTGTQRGMTDQQKLVVRDILRKSAKEFHFGDCLGADREAYLIAKKLDIWTEAWPPINESKRAFCKADVIHIAGDYLERDHWIVDATKGLLATPKGMEEEQRSGTWATVRYARKLHRLVIFVYPNGLCKQEN